MRVGEGLKILLSQKKEKKDGKQILCFITKTAHIEQLLASKRSERDTLRSVQLRIVYYYIYIIVRAIFVLITRKEGGA